MAAERSVKKAYSSPSLKKWGSVKDLTTGGDKIGTSDGGVGSYIERTMTEGGSSY